MVRIETVNKDQAILDWILAKGTPILFNVLPDEPGSCAFVPISAEAVIKRYMHGGAKKKYDFAFQYMAPFSQTTDTTNTDAMCAMRQWQSWIDEQESAANYPNFGDKCSDYRFENQSNMPQLAMAYPDNQVAKYQFMATLFYYESK